MSFSFASFDRRGFDADDGAALDVGLVLPLVIDLRGGILNFYIGFATPCRQFHAQNLRRSDARNGSEFN